MNLLSKHKQTVTYWEPAIPDGFGKMSFAYPVDLRGKWEDGQVLVIDNKGKEVLASSFVSVMGEVLVDGYLWLGSAALLDSLQALDPTTVPGAKRIIKSDKTTSLRGSTLVHEAWLR